MRPLHAWRPLLRSFHRPTDTLEWTPGTWDVQLQRLKITGLLGRFAHQLQDAGLFERAPQVARHAMASAQRLAREQARSLHWELRLLDQELGSVAGPVVLLKGAAYVASGQAVHRGRSFSDIDLMVPHAQLHLTEMSLRFSGWVFNTDNAYDQRYYREWMHELPPLMHMKRGTSLDLHHRLLPRTARTPTDPAPVLAAAEALPDTARFRVPCALDRILHSACHLFHESEWHNGLRDLSDLDLLLREQVAQQGDAFLPALVERAAVLNLARPLHHALRYTALVWETPLPAHHPDPFARPSGLQQALLDALFLRVFFAPHKPSRGAGTVWAERLLYVRGHYLRMPLRLLIPHLATKAYRAWRDRRLEAEKDTPP